VRTIASLEERLHELEERERCHQGHNQRGGPEAEAEQCMSRPTMPTSSTSCSDESEARRLFAGVRARRELYGLYELKDRQLALSESEVHVATRTR
jgi:hypothetical protein